MPSPEPAEEIGVLSAQQAEEKELYEAFTVLSTDPELSDVEFAFDAQAEVALRD